MLTYASLISHRKTNASIGSEFISHFELEVFWKMLPNLGLVNIRVAHTRGTDYSLVTEKTEDRKAGNSS